MASASSLEQLLTALKAETPSGRGPAPVERWNPEHCGDIGMEILRDGSWRHEGMRITREPLVRLFASILRKDEDGATYLVTPAEKIIVRVEDAPFLAVRVDRVGAGETQTLAFTTNVGDVITAGPANPIRVEYNNEEPRPYVLIRGRLEARILRAQFYEIVEWADPRDSKLGIWSGGMWFGIEK